MKKISKSKDEDGLRKGKAPARKSRYKSYPVRIRVVKQQGHCGMGHRVGDEWMYNFEPGKPSPPPICEVALHTIFGHLRTLWFGGTFPWPTPDPDTCIVACTDAKNPVWFELKRFKNKPIYLKYKNEV